MRHNGEPFPFRGGQGRDDEEIYAVGWALVSSFIWLVVAPALFVGAVYACALLGSLLRGWVLS